MTRTELIELLKKARKQLKKYHVPKDEQTITLRIDAIENALLEQPEIVRCKDCAKRPCIYVVANKSTDDWFCANGERNQQIVEPLKIKKGEVGGYYGAMARCPSCEASWVLCVDDTMRYCPSCGKRVEWDE